MKRILALLAVLLIGGYSTIAQIATYTGAGGTSTAVVGVANETVSILQNIGFGTNTACGSGGMSGITVNTIWTTYSIAGPHVFFKITPNAGFQLNLTGFTAGLRRSGTGPVNTRFAYSLDNGATWLDDGTNHLASTGGCGTTLVTAWGGSGSALPTGVTSTTNGVIVALFPFAPGGSTGTYQVNTIVINGSVVPACTPPTAFAVTGGGSYCAGATGVAVGMSNSESGATYQLYNGSTTVGSPVAGTGSGFSFGLQTAAGTYTVQASAGAGCNSNMTGSAVVTINLVPSPIGGSLSLCEGTMSSLSDASTGGTWSSSTTANATIGSSSGVVTGVAGGFSTITYTLGTGCGVTAVVTVNTAPQPITGNLNVCVGGTTTLADVTGPGTWTSTNTTVATIGSSNGAVTGLTAGTSTITYQLAGGCYTTSVVTVDPQPAAITGAFTICNTTSTTLGNSVAGGVWTSSNTGVATIGSSSGVLASVSAGTSNITYTTTWCTPVVQTITVNPFAAITGSPLTCTGTTTTLSNAVAGGVWISSNTGIATVGTNGVVTGVAIGTVSISYLQPTGCNAGVIVTVNQLGPITGLLTVCQGSTTTLGNIITGGTWSINPTSVATIGSASGIVTGVGAGVAIATYTISSGCSATAALLVNAVPAAITGTGAVCENATVTLADATAGGSWSSTDPTIATISGAGVVTGVMANTVIISYTLPTGCAATRTESVNPLPAAITPVPAYVCIGSAIPLSSGPGVGAWSSQNTFVSTINPATGVAIGIHGGSTNITYQLIATGCYRTATLNVSTPPGAIGSTDSVCEGSSVALTNAVPGGTWTSNNPAIASVDPSGVVTGVITGITIISYTTIACAPQTFSLTVNAMPAPIIGFGNVCTGYTTTLSDLSAGGTWAASGSSATVSSSGVVTGLAWGNSTVVSYTLPSGCYRSVPIIVDSLPLAITGIDSVCQGSSIVLSDGTPNGIWSSSNGVIASVIADTGIVTGVAPGNATISYTLLTGCYVTTPLKVITPLPASVTMTSTAPAPLCAGTPVTFTPHPVNGGTPTYQWRKFGVTVDSGATFTYVPEHGDYIMCIMYAHNICAAPAGVDDSMTMIVYPNAAPVITIRSDYSSFATTGNSCAPVSGVMVTSSITKDSATLNWPAVSGSIGYEWAVATSPAPPASGMSTNLTTAMTTGLNALTRPYYVLVRNLCSSGGASDWTSNPLVINYYGEIVTFFTDVTFGGTSPVYQWYKNGVAIPGATLSSYSEHVYHNDTFYCQITSNSPCQSTTSAFSNTIIVMSSPLGVTNVAAGGSELSLFPNPNTGTFMLTGQLNDQSANDALFEVSDVLGHIIYQGTIIPQNGAIREQIILGNEVAPGSYLLKLTTAKETHSYHFAIRQ